jgi:flagellar hook-basal body complex protein FliE
MQRIDPSIISIPEQNSSPVFEKKGTSFSDMLTNAFENVNEDQNKANTAMKELIAGKNKNIHETMLIMEKADISLKMMMQIRNKMIDAYKEIMRMQI